MNKPRESMPQPYKTVLARVLDEPDARFTNSHLQYSYSDEEAFVDDDGEWWYAGSSDRIKSRVLWWKEISG